VRPKLVLVMALLCTALPFAGQYAGDRSSGWLMVDFRAYYCGALAQREGRNPYFTASVSECQRRTPAPYYRSAKNVAVPAPYPPYALALLYPLTFMPFGEAAIAWWTVLAIALGLAAYGLGRVARQPSAVAWGALALSLGLASWTSGNIVPLAVAALVLAALLAERRRFGPAAAATIVALIEPQIALPAAVALFIGYREMRVGLGTGIVALPLISIALAGPAQAIFYCTTVLPAHALAEVSRDNQYSVSTVLAALGTPDTPAVVAGSVSYIVMSIVGIVVALRLARRYDAPAIAALVPPALSLVGGSFVHTAEIGAAVPACLVLFTRVAEYRGWLFAALLLLAVPWMLATSAALFLAPLYPAAYLAFVLYKRDRTFAVAVAVAVFALIAGLFALASAPADHAVAYARVHPAIDPRLAESGWRALVLGNTTNRPVMWLLRLPTWSGLIVLASTAITFARRLPISIADRDRPLLESRA
jgi:hypothetical protein